MDSSKLIWVTMSVFVLYSLSLLAPCSDYLEAAKANEQFENMLKN